MDGRVLHTVNELNTNDRDFEPLISFAYPTVVGFFLCVC